MKTILFLVLALSACTYKGYPGPDRPAHELSNVFISKDAGVSLERIVVDDFEVSTFADAVNIPAGKHEIELGYRAEFDNCTDEDRLCQVSVGYGVCSGNFETLPERNYLIYLDLNYSLLSGRFSPKGYFDFSNRDDEQVLDLYCRESNSFGYYR